VYLLSFIKIWLQNTNNPETMKSRDASASKNSFTAGLDKSDVWSEVAGTQVLIGEVSGGTKTRLRLCFYKASVSFRISNCVLS